MKPSSSADKRASIAQLQKSSSETHCSRPRIQSAFITSKAQYKRLSTAKMSTALKDTTTVGSGGPSYSVKYLGIVDGAMGVLSRKMPIQPLAKDQSKSVSEVVSMNQKMSQALIARTTAHTNLIRQRRISYNSSQNQCDIQIKTFTTLKPVLGKKYDRTFSKTKGDDLFRIKTQSKSRQPNIQSIQQQLLQEEAGGDYLDCQEVKVIGHNRIPYNDTSSLHTSAEFKNQSVKHLLMQQATEGVSHQSMSRQGNRPELKSRAASNQTEGNPIVKKVNPSINDLQHIVFTENKTGETPDIEVVQGQVNILNLNMSSKEVDSRHGSTFHHTKKQSENFKSNHSRENSQGLIHHQPPHPEDVNSSKERGLVGLSGGLSAGTVSGPMQGTKMNMLSANQYQSSLVNETNQTSNKDSQGGSVKESSRDNQSQLMGHQEKLRSSGQTSPPPLMSHQIGTPDVTVNNGSSVNNNLAGGSPILNSCFSPSSTALHSGHQINFFPKPILLESDFQKNTGYPNPGLYDQHFINKYAYPKGLKCQSKKPEDNHAGMKKKKSIFSMKAPETRRGFTGWKLTKRPNVLPGTQPMTQDIRQEVHSPGKKDQALKQRSPLSRKKSPPKTKQTIKKLLRKYKRMSSKAASARQQDAHADNETACFPQSDSLPIGVSPSGVSFFPTNQPQDSQQLQADLNRLLEVSKKFKQFNTNSTSSQVGGTPATGARGQQNTLPSYITSNIGESITNIEVGRTDVPRYAHSKL